MRLFGTTLDEVKEWHREIAATWTIWGGKLLRDVVEKHATFIIQIQALSKEVSEVKEIVRALAHALDCEIIPPTTTPEHRTPFMVKRTQPVGVRFPLWLDEAPSFLHSAGLSLGVDVPKEIRRKRVSHAKHAVKRKRKPTRKSRR